MGEVKQERQTGPAASGVIPRRDKGIPSMLSGFQWVEI